MEKQQNIESTTLKSELKDQVSKINFYRFCQLLEQSTGYQYRIGNNETPILDPIRFAPAPDMSFPAGELYEIEKHPYLNRPETVRVRFLGLYGVESPLPFSLIDNIIRKEEGYEVMMDFLDVFNHRLIALYYRIWLKYHYPAAFLEGGADETSKCLLGLVGLGIEGSEKHLESPSSRILSLLGIASQKTRTKDGIAALVKVLVNGASVKVQEFFPIWESVPQPAKFGKYRIALDGSQVLGGRFKEVNQTIKMIIIPQYESHISELLPGGQLNKDLLALLRYYLGYRTDAKLQLCIKYNFLPRAQLTSNQSRLGLTASLRSSDNLSHDDVIVNIGYYRGI